jgi:hypothetical protein
MRRKHVSISFGPILIVFQWQKRRRTSSLIERSSLMPKKRTKLPVARDRVLHKGSMIYIAPPENDIY